MVHLENVNCFPLTSTLLGEVNTALPKNTSTPKLLNRSALSFGAMNAPIPRPPSNSPAMGALMPISGDAIARITQPIASVCFAIASTCARSSIR